jgi:hypothetical protein
LARFDSAALFAEARSRALAPASATTAPGWEDADLLRMANGEMLKIAKELRLKREGFFNVVKDTAFTSGTASYRILTRSMHGSVSLVQRVASDGAVSRLERWKEADLAGRNPTNTGIPEAYLWRGNSLVFYPTPDSAATAYSYRLVYPRRPNKLVSVATTVVGIVSSKTATTVTLTANAPSTFSTSTPLDFIQANAPFDSLADDKTPTVVSGTGLTFTSGDIPSTLAAGDFVCLAEEAPVIQMPPEAFYVVAHRMAIKLAGHDTELVTTLAAELPALEADLFGGAEDRDPDEAPSVAARHWA